jgi:hypothetical protein
VVFLKAYCFPIGKPVSPNFCFCNAQRARGSYCGVVTRRLFKRPAAAKMKAPEQTDATRRTRDAIERTHSTRDGSLQAGPTSSPPATTKVSNPSLMSQ